ncbi:MAG: hypothetical protein BECKG1743E_GA0114224_105501, partial [Candidatus Kentron sp. G]
YGIESRRKNCVYILVLPPMTIQCQYHWLLSLRGGRVTPDWHSGYDDSLALGWSWYLCYSKGRVN